MSITATSSIANAYASIYGLATASSRSRQAPAVDGKSQEATASATVNISPAAEEAAKNDAGKRFKLPEGTFWTRKDFPADILAEAKARLEARQAAPGIGDGYLPDRVNSLPLLPENQALLERFRQEMKEIGPTNADPEKNARFNQLLNLSLRVQIEGWKAPMTEADAQREFDISCAMGMLGAAAGNPAEPAKAPEVEPDPLASWKRRWQEEGLEMPAASPEPTKSMWLDLAGKAGIGEAEFLAKARDLAAGLKGNALTQAIERFISERYVAGKGA